MRRAVSELTLRLFFDERLVCALEVSQAGELLIPTNGAATTHILKPMIEGALGD
jgi:hypothetical protein